jgi:hypothetical protein
MLINCVAYQDGRKLADLDIEEISDYLEKPDCILAHGFARAYCDECQHDFLIAYSCKCRGVCPSCNTRRMAETAAPLVDHVFPPLPMRKLVLVMPKHRNGLARPGSLTK